MNNNLSINKLKELIVASPDLNTVINYFFDMLDAELLPTNPAEEIESSEIQMLFGAVGDVVGEYFNLKATVKCVMLEQTVDKQIFHGLCSVSEKLSPANILYMSELKIAIVFIQHNQKTEMWRLSIHEPSNSQVTYH